MTSYPRWPLRWRTYLAKLGVQPGPLWGWSDAVPHWHWYSFLNFGPTQTIVIFIVFLVIIYNNIFLQTRVKDSRLWDCLLLWLELSSTVLWSRRQYTCWDERTCENPVMTFPIKKRNNTIQQQPFVKQRVGSELWPIKVISQVALADWTLMSTLQWSAFFISKGLGMRDQLWACFEISLNGMWKKLYIVLKTSSKWKKKKYLDWAHYMIIYLHFKINFGIDLPDMSQNWVTTWRRLMI